MAWLFIISTAILLLIGLKLIADKKSKPTNNFTADVIHLARAKNGNN
jgi:hypothetical protein